MSRRLIASVIALAAMAACASAPDDVASAQPTSAASQPSSDPAPSLPPADTSGAAASAVTVPTPRPARPASDDEVVVPGVQNQQVQPPRGDPRTTSQRMEDIRAWDSCVMRAQGASSADPMRPQLDSPEEVCRSRLGMSSRTSVPSSRRP